MNVAEARKAPQKYGFTAKHIQQATGFDRRTIQKFLNGEGQTLFSTENAILQAIDQLIKQRSTSLPDPRMRATGT